jgi:TonB-linked SusC/RagA family outer membrane protein
MHVSSFALSAPANRHLTSTRYLRTFRQLALSLAALSIPAATTMAQTASVSGRVVDATSGQPVPTARVSVVGTQIATQTSADGRYVLRGLEPGPVTLRVSSIGYVEQRRQVTISAAEPSTVNFELRSVAVALSEVVVTATGEQQRVEMGNAITQMNAAEVVERSAVSNMADLLTARAAGVMVIPGTQTGAGVRVRIRGTSSLSLSNNPIYVVDGARVEGTTGSSSVSVGGTTPARINDLNPEEIESIEIVRGPSASALYGTAAANGVVVIRTKRGIVGPPQWTYYTEQTAITDRNDYSTAYRAWRTGTTSTTNSTPANTVQCFLSQRAAGTCTQDSVTSYNLHRDSEATPFGVGYRQQHGLQLRGGSETIRYFLHGEWEEENGRIKLPEFDQRWLANRGLSLRPEQANPNYLGQMTARANLNIALPNNADIAVSAGYITSELRLPRSDDSGTPGIAANTYGGPGFKYNVNAAGDTLYGWREFLPRQIYQAVTQQDINRLISSINANWRPRSWLDLRGTFGLDYIGRKDTQLCMFQECTQPLDREGFKIDNRTNFFIYTLTAGGTATRQLSDRFESQTAIGVQFNRNLFNRNGAQGTQLSPGAITVQAGAVRNASEVNEESRTLGAYIEERLAVNNRLFLTAAVRSDRNSAFGANFKTVFYPKLAASWLLTEEPFFRAPGWVNQIRLRSAYGASGVQPGTTDAVPFYSPTRTLGESGEQPGLLFQALGNVNLKPERSTELELGVDASLWDNRLSIELTHYTKNSKDALINRPLPPSVGTGATARFENLGHVRNSGWEALVGIDLLRRPAFGWDMTLNAATNSNEIVSLGGLPTIISSSTIRQVQGSPLNAWWARRLVSYADNDGNGIITLGEIVVSDTAEYHGYSVPRYEATLVNGFDLWQRRVRVAAMVDYKGGHLVYNNSERIRCASRVNCSGLINPQSSFYEQARTVMVREHSSASAAGFFEPGDFLRLRELNVSFTVPEHLTGRFLNTRSMVATLAARNLGMLWTKYSGVDPEAFGTTGDSPSSFQAFAPPTYFSFRLTLGL